MISLSHGMTYRFSMKELLLPTTEGFPHGRRQYWEMSRGTLWGSGIEATIALPDGDWNSINNDGFSRADVRVQFLTSDNELILYDMTDLLSQMKNSSMPQAKIDRPISMITTYGW
jgi:hypothetical protein